MADYCEHLFHANINSKANKASDEEGSVFFERHILQSPEERKLMSQLLHRNHSRQLESRLLNFLILLLILFIIFQSLAILAAKSQLDQTHFSESQSQTINTLHLIIPLATRLLAAGSLLLFAVRVVQISMGPIEKELDAWAFIEFYILDLFSKSASLFFLLSLDQLLNKIIRKTALTSNSMPEGFIALETLVQRTVVIEYVWIGSLSIIGMIFIANRFVKAESAVAL